jgi:hypothetical protein
VAGPVNWSFGGGEAFVVLGIVVAIPSFLTAVAGSVIHALVRARQGEDVVVLTLFVKWWLWSALGWAVALLLGVVLG